MGKKSLHNNQFRVAKRYVFRFAVSVGGYSLHKLKLAEAIRFFAHKNNLTVLGNPSEWIVKTYIDNKSLFKSEPTKKTPVKKSFKKSKSLLLSRKYRNVQAGIYKISCSENGRFYIGSSNNIERRWLIHQLELKNKAHHNYRLQADFDLYGVDKFSFEVLWLPSSSISRDSLYEAEQCFMDDLKPFYNIQKEALPKPPGNKNKRFNRHRKMKTPKLQEHKPVGSDKCLT